MEGIEGSGKFEAATADVGGALSDFDRCSGGNSMAGLFGFLAVDEDGSGKDKGAGLFAGFSESAIDQ